MSGEYRVNKTTGQVIKDDGTGWKPVASVRNKNTGEILIDEGNGWQPMPGSQRDLTEDRGMMLASERANTAFRSNQPIAKDDLARLSKPDFSTAAMARLPAPTMTPQQLDAFDAEQAAESERLRVPDNDAKERFVIGSNIGTFGHGPQAMAGASTVGALLATPFIEGDIIDREGVSGAMSQFLNEARVHQRRGREERPIESYGGEIIGSFLQGKTLIDGVGKKLLPKTNTASNVTRVAGTGAAYGSLYGLGQSESDTLEGALGDAAFGGALGAGGGLAFKAAEPAVTATYRTAKTGAASLSDALSAALGKAGGARDRVAEDVAIAAVRRSMERSGMTFDEIMEQVKRYEGKPAVLAEVIGQDAVNALTALTRRPGATPQKAQAIIEERAFARPERMRGDVEDATGIPIGQLDETLAKQLEERQAAAKPLYDALYKRFNKIEAFRQPGQTGQVMKRLNRLARTPLAQRHLQLAKDAVATIAGRRGIAVSKMSTMEYWDLVKRSLDDAIDSAKAKGENRTRVGEGIEDLVGLKNDLVDELDRLTGGAYAAAREVGGEAPRLKAAAVAGQKALQARNPREVAKTVAATLSQDLPALRAGVVDDLGTRIDRGMLPSRVRVPDVAGKLRASLGEESANKLINKLDAEATLSETGSRWAPRLNSVTGTVMESGATQMGDDLINAGFNLATGNKVGLFRQAINFMRQRGFSQRQIDAIGDLLLSSPEEGLKRLRVMKPDGAPSAAIGAASGGAVPPPSGSPTPSPNALAPQGPIRAAGFTGFHGTQRNFDKFDLSQSEDALGVHFGTKSQAEARNRTTGFDNAPNRVIEAEIQDGNYLELPDLNLWRPQAVRQALSAKGIELPESVQTNAQIRDYLASQGYDGIRYANRAEGAGESVIVFDPNKAAIIGESSTPMSLPTAPANRPNPLRGDLGNALAGAGLGAAGPADSNEERLRNMAVGAGIGFGARRVGKAFGAQADGAVPKPVPPKAPRTVGKSKLGTRTADAAAIAALSTAPPAQADTGGGAELEAANERVRIASDRVLQIEKTAIPQLENDLRLIEDPKADPRALQELLARRGLYKGPIDGVIGPQSRDAIAENRKMIRDDLQTQRAELEQARNEETAARQGLKQAEMREIQRKAEPNAALNLAGLVGTTAAIAGGIYLAKKGRAGAVAKSVPAAASATRKANALIVAKAKAPTTAKTGPNSVNERAAKVNEFWKQGGAGKKVPFTVDDKGAWNARPNATEPAELFNPKWYQQYRSGDALAMSVAALDAGGSRLGINKLNEEIEKTEADIKRYEQEGNIAGMERAIKHKTLLEGTRTFAQIMEKLGYGYLAGRAISSPLMPYAKATPNIVNAERERALLLQAMNRPPKAPKTP